MLIQTHYNNNIENIFTKINQIGFGPRGKILLNNSSKVYKHSEAFGEICASHLFEWPVL